MTMTNDTASEVQEICTICHKPQDGHNYRHKFSPQGGKTGGLIKTGDQSAKGQPASEGSVRTLPGGDPVLRMVLLRKGLITVEDIETVEAELRATGVAGHDPGQALAQP